MKTYFYVGGTERCFSNDVPRLRERIEREARKEQDEEIRGAIQSKSASGFLKETEKP